MKKIAVFFFTQSGQLKQILDSILKDVQENGIHVDFYPIVPEKPFPFPWTSDTFFNEFPETVSLTPRPVHSVEFTDENYDLIILGWQSWYLSPSQPITAFLQSPSAKKALKGKPLLLISGNRNMWIMAFQDLKNMLRECEATLVGNIVLEDKNPNLKSVRTIFKWMLTGNKGPYDKYPEAGVSTKDIEKAGRFGPLISQAVRSGNYPSLQTELLKEKAVEVKFPIFMVEKNGKKIFRIWSGFILRKGNAENPARMPRVRMFKNYLLFMIFVISPVPAFLFGIFNKIAPSCTRKIVDSYTNLNY